MKKERSKPHTYTCDTCHIKFNAERKSSKNAYCSIRCYRQARAVEKSRFKCDFCSRIFNEYHSKKKGKVKIFCSKPCAWRFQKGKPLSTNTIEKMKKSHLGMYIGEKSPNWRGGKVSLTKGIRYSYKYKEWRDAVFNRDNFTCLVCGIRGGELNADHYPKLFSEIFRENNINSLEEAYRCEEFWDINNGRTLCVPCHRKYGKKRPDTKKINYYLA